MIELKDEIATLGTLPLLPPGPDGDIAAVAAAVVAMLLSSQTGEFAHDDFSGWRLAAGGQIPPDLRCGKLVVWGSFAQQVPAGVTLSVTATSGPASRAVLGGPEVYGHPAWLLPWFYRPNVIKTHDLCFVIAPGEIVPANLPDGVCAISAAAPRSPAALRERLDMMLGSARIASATLGGLVLAEAYGLPCLPLATGESGGGLKRLATTPECLDAQVADFYAGLRRNAVPAYMMMPDALPNFDRLMAAIDQAWSPAWLREDDLIESFPLLRVPLRPEAAASVLTREAFSWRNSLAAPSVARREVSADLQDWVDENGEVPLGWAATSEQAPYPNLGDALSAVVVSAIAGLPLQRRNFDDRGERMVAVGTIGHAQRNGVAHLWGTGLDPKRNAFDPSLGRFAVPPDTCFAVHATRGRNTARCLREAGVDCPEIFGDPVSFLPRMMRDRPVQARWELGVILHITEVDGHAPDSAVMAAYQRYLIPQMLAGSIKLISTYTDQGTEALLAKVDEIRACRRIVSTSFHGLVIPESFGIPNMWFSTHPGGAMMADLHDLTIPVDHRLRDWLSGSGRRHLPIFGAQRHLPTRWDQVIRWLDTAWEPMQIDDQALFDAFPLRKAARWEDEAWPLAPALFEQARY